MRIRKVTRELVYILLAVAIGLVYGICAGVAIL